MQGFMVQVGIPGFLGFDVVGLRFVGLLVCFGCVIHNPQPNNHNLTNPQAPNPLLLPPSPHTHTFLHWISSSPLSLHLPSPGFPNLNRKEKPEPIPSKKA